MRSSKNKCAYIRDLSDCTIQIIYHGWWASMNVRSKRPKAWKNSGHAPSWWFYVHCTIEETCSPGIICIMCHQVLCHPSEHGASSMGKHCLAQVHIAKLNEITESEGYEVTSRAIEKTLLPILKRQGGRGITIGSSPKEFIFHSLIFPIFIQWTDITLQTSSNGLCNFQISLRDLESQLNVGICFGSYPLVCCIKLPCTDIVYYLDRTGVLREVNLAFAEVECLPFAYSES